jgi:hypothetical protein
MQEKSPYRQKKILLTALRKKCLPCRENSAYRTKKNLLTGWRKYSLPHDGKFILPCIQKLMEHFGEPFEDYLEDLMPWSEKLPDECKKKNF